MWKWFFSPEARWWQVALLSIAVMVLYPMWCVIYWLTIHDHLPEWMNLAYSRNFLFDNRYTPLSFQILYSLPFVGPAFETLFFAALPMDSALRRTSGWRFLAVALVTTFAFAYLHGGMPRIPIQGVAGLMFIYVYLKCGGWQGKFLVPFLITTVVHELTNTVLNILANSTSSLGNLGLL